MSTDTYLSLQGDYAMKALAILQCGVSNANEKHALGDAMGVPPAGFIGDQEFSRRTTDQLRGRAPGSDLQVLTDCRKLCRSALKLAQAGSFADSEKTLQVAKRMGEHIETAEARAIVDSHWFAASAYLSHKMGSCDDALQKLWSSMLRDEELENKFQYPLFHLHRIHLAANAIKVDVKRGNLRGACTVCGEILAYLAGSSESVSLPGSWGWRHLSLPASNFRVFFATVSGELAHLLAAMEAGTAKELFALSTGFMNGSSEADHVDETAMTWFLAKRHVLHGEMQEFLAAARQLLATAPSYLNAKLWCATALDVLSLCESTQNEVGDLLSEVAPYFKKWSFMNDSVKAFLGNRFVQFEVLSLGASVPLVN